MKKTIEDKIKLLNNSGKIKIELRKTRGKKRVVLRMYKNYKDTYLFLDLFITDDQKKNEMVLKIVEEIKIKKEFEIAQNNLDHIPKDEKSDTTKTDFRAFYLNQIRNKNLKNKEYYTNALNVFMKFLKKDTDIMKITPAIIEDYARTITHLSTHTQFAYISALKIILNDAIKQEIITKNPVQIRIKREEPKTVFLTIEEIQRINQITDKVNIQVRNAFLFSCFTGLRKSDIYNLTWDNIEEGYLSVLQQKTKNIVRMKLSETAKEILNLQPKISDNIFNLPNYKNLRIALHKIINLAQINKKATFHSARHTFGTLCVTYGIDIFTTKELMGHTDIETTLKYTKLVSKKKDEAIDKLPKI